MNILLKDKRVELRLAGLDILNSLVKECNETDIKIIETGKALALAISKPTEREQIFLKEIFKEDAEDHDTSEETELYTEDDIIKVPPVSCDKSVYPLFTITEKRLADLFQKLDDLIDEYKDYEIKTAYGEKVLLGNQNHLPVLKYNGTPEEKYPLMPVWKHFYETEVKNPEDLMAMIFALTPHVITVGYGNAAITDKAYNKFIKTTAEAVFGKAVLSFEPSLYKYGNGDNRAISYAIVGGDLFRDI